MKQTPAGPPLWEQFRRNAGLDDPLWRKFVGLWILVLGGILAITAVVSLDFYQGDEHFQILEFVNYKLQGIPASLMSWEFHTQMRPWLQPAVYLGIAKLVGKLGLHDPFVLAAAFRLLSGLFAWIMLSSMMLLSYHFFSDSSRRRASVYLLALLCFLPYMFVRTTSESWSTSFCLLGYALLLLGSRRLEGERRDFPGGVLFVVGLLWGLAFEFRVQCAFLILGFLLWMLFVARNKTSTAILGIVIVGAGMAVTVALGTVVDWWGYGNPVFVPWNYFFQNIVRNASSNFGTLPWWAYFVLANNNLIAFVAIPLTVGILVAWVRYPKHSLVWGSLLYFLAHVAVAHKEARFLFPLAVPAAILFIYAWTPKFSKEDLFSRIWARRRAWVFQVLFVLNAVGLIYALTKHNVDLQFDQYAYYHLKAPYHVYVLRDSFALHPFYERDYRSLSKEVSVTDLTIDASSKVQSFLLTDGLDEYSPPPDVRFHLSYVESSLPLWIKQLNVLHWESKIKTWTLYRVEPQ